MKNSTYLLFFIYGLLFSGCAKSSFIEGLQDPEKPISVEIVDKINITTSSATIVSQVNNLGSAEIQSVWAMVQSVSFTSTDLGSPITKQGSGLVGDRFTLTFDWLPGTGNEKLFLRTSVNLKDGRIIYSKEEIFYTAGSNPNPSGDLPIVTTNGFMIQPGNPIKASGSITVTSTGNSTTESGVCWGESLNPVYGVSNSISLGSGLGTFSGTISNLMPERTYYVRAYAKNSKGISYSENNTLAVPRYLIYTFKVDMTDYLGSTGGAVYIKGNFPEVGGDIQSAWNDVPSSGQMQQSGNIYSRTVVFTNTWSGSLLQFKFKTQNNVWESTTSNCFVSDGKPTPSYNRVLPLNGPAGFYTYSAKWNKCP